jgi:hypothetical protein
MSAVDRLGVDGSVAGSAGRPSLSSLLVEAGVASEEQVRLAAAEGMGNGERLGEVALRRGWVDQRGLARLLARQWGFRFLDQDALESAVIDPQRLPPELARRLAACPIALADGERVVVVAEPTSSRVSELGQALGAEAAIAVVASASLTRLLERLDAGPAQEPGARPTAPAEGLLVVEDAQAELLLSELGAATAALAALSGRVEQVARSRHAVERELGQLRAEHERQKRECAQEQARASQWEQELGRERARNRAIKTRLGELLHQLDDSPDAG